MIVNDETVRAANIREIIFKGGVEKELRKRDAIYELAGELVECNESSKIEIDTFDLEPLSVFVSRELLVKVYKDRHDCPIGGLARHKNETEYTLLRWTGFLGTIQLRYQLFVVQSKPDSQPVIYWVRTE